MCFYNLGSVSCGYLRVLMLSKYLLSRIVRFRVTDWLLLLLIATAVGGAAHIFVRTSSHGAGLSYDSVVYISTAENLIAGEGLKPLYGEFVHWPPLFPLLLAGLGYLGIEGADAGRFLNIVAFGLVIFVSGLWMLRNLMSAIVFMAGLVAVAVSYGVNYVSSHVWTEPLFILFVLVALLHMGSFLKGDVPTRSWWIGLILAGVFSALAALTRYPGITVIFVGVVLLMLRRDSRPLIKFRDVFVYGSISSFPLLIVLARNFAVSGTLTGARLNTTGNSITQTFGEMLSVFHRWGFAGSDLEWWHYYLWALFGAIVLMSIAVFILQRRKEAVSVWSFRDSDNVAPFALFAVVYLAFLVSLVPFTLGHEIDDRLLSAAYVPLILVFAFLFDRFFVMVCDGRLNLARWVLVFLIVCLCSGNILATLRLDLRETSRALDSGYIYLTYNTEYWNNSETLDYLKLHPIAGDVYSNEFPLLWLEHESDGDVASVESVYRPTPAALDDLFNWIGEADDVVHVVWLSIRPKSRSEYNFRFTPGVDLISEFSDGSIYRVKRGEYSSDEERRVKTKRNFRKFLDAYRSSSDAVIDSEFDVYIDNHKLIYVKEPCKNTDTDHSFYLHLDVYRLGQIAIENLDFNFSRYGARFDDICIAGVDVSRHDPFKVRTGQWARGESTLWNVEYDFVAGEVSSVLDELQTAGIGPLIRSNFDVYMDSGRLIYRNSDCNAADRDTSFFLHLDPVDVDDLPVDRRGHGFGNLNFNLLQHGGETAGGECVALIDLPDYEISHVHTGQFNQDERIWEDEFDVHAAEVLNEAQKLRVSGHKAMISSDFDVYLGDGELLYLKEEGCVEPDDMHPFFLHVFPVDVNDLPESQRGLGVENLDFEFSEHVKIWNVGCYGRVPLPDYEISRVRTGQWIRGDDRIWDGEFDFYAVEIFNETLELRFRGHDAVIGSNFNVYLGDGELLYLKEEGCVVPDDEHPFFLHIFPVDVNNLPEEHRLYEVANLDFEFSEHMKIWNDGCYGRVPLPDYEISRVRTGQWIRGDDRIWDGEFDFYAVDVLNEARELRRNGHDAVSRSSFDIYIGDSAFLYIKENGCMESDDEHPFFLHVFPVDVNDLSEEHRLYEVENLDFEFSKHMKMWEDGCYGRVPLPDYEISRIRTGQWIRGEDRIWDVEFWVGD